MVLELGRIAPGSRVQGLGQLEHHARPAQLGERILGRSGAHPRARRQRVGRPVVIGDDDVDPELRGAGHRVDGRDAAVDRDEQANAVARQPLDRLDGQAVALVEPAREMRLDLGAEPAQHRHGKRGRADAVRVVVAVDADRLAGRDRALEAHARGGHVAQKHRIVRRAVLVEERPRRIGGRMAAPDQHLGGRPPDAQLVREPVSILRRARVDQPGGRGLGHPAMLGRPSDVAYPGAIGARANLHVTTWGQGDRALLVHGSMGFGELAFSEQRPLAARRQLDVVDRRGYGESPARSARVDFDVRRGTSSATRMEASCASSPPPAAPRRFGRSPSSSRPRSRSYAAIRPSRRSSRGSAATTRPGRRSARRRFSKGFCVPGASKTRRRAGSLHGLDGLRRPASRFSWPAAPGTRLSRGTRPRRGGVRGRLPRPRRAARRRGGGLPGSGAPAAAPRRALQRPSGDVLALGLRAGLSGRSRRRGRTPGPTRPGTRRAPARACRRCASRRRPRSR